MESRKLGSAAFASSAIALGCMSMSDPEGRSEAAEQESIATIHQAIDSGVTLLDTGDFYGMGHNEMLIGRALRERRKQIQLSVKFGALRDSRGTFIGFDGRPAFVKSSLAYTLQRLGTDHVDFYFPARVDPNVPIEETIGAVADLIREGKVLYAGLSEASAQTLRRAHAVHPVSALEIEYSLWSRDIEDEILPVARELGVGILAYSALSRGLLTGALPTLDAQDFRMHFPRFQGGNIAANLRLVESLRKIAGSRDATVAQIAIAWVLAQGVDIVAVVGTKRRAYLSENLAAADLHLTAAELAAIEEAVPRGSAAGARYPVPAMASVNL
jgi:aryl-alcohol dehydrogenase-like predicted oxidoreductase